MDDLDPEIKEEEEVEDELDETLEPGAKKKSGKDLDEDSLDALADEEEGVLPEDSFDDAEPEDLW